MKKLLLTSLVTTVIIAVIFFSCRKNSSESSRKNAIQEIFSKPQKVFTGHISRTNEGVKVVGKTTSCYTTTYELWYTISSLPCGTISPNPTTTNDYQIDFLLAVYSDPAYCSGPKNSTVDPQVSNFVYHLNSVTGDQSPSQPTAFDACGLSVSGSYLFSTLGITSSNPNLSIDFSGDWVSSQGCGNESFSNSGINVDLFPNVCTQSYSTGITSEVYPNNTSHSNSSFDVFFPWDNLCFSAYFVPSTWSQVEVEYYLYPSGTHSYATANYFPTGPWVINVSATGTYYVRSRYKCSGGANGPWSSWKTVSVP